MLINPPTARTQGHLAELSDRDKCPGELRNVTHLINFNKLPFVCVNFKRHFGNLPTEKHAFKPNSQINTKLHTTHFNQHLTYSIYVGLIAIT